MDPKKYVGIPFRMGGRDRNGVDCYGLIYLAYLEEYGIELPRYDGVPNGAERAEVTNMLIDGARYGGKWQRVEDPRTGDVVELKLLRVSHIGLYVEPGMMLHALDAPGVVLEGLDRPKYRRRMNGCFRLVT